MRGKRVLVAAAVVAVAAGVVGGGWGVHRAYAVHQACESIRSYERSTGPVQHIGEAGDTWTVLGDSYSTGDMLEDRHDAWTYAVAKSHRLRLNVVAQGGTGYVNEGFCGDGSFSERASKVPSDGSPVIIEGGLNDLAADQGVLRDAARRLVDKFSGDRPVVLIGPVDAPNEHGERAVDATLRSVAADRRTTYISGLAWDDIDFGPDGKHMSPSGHKVFAEHVYEALEGTQS